MVDEKISVQVKSPTHRLVRLVDKDSDGRFEQGSVFADKLSFPEGAMWLEGALYVGAPPTIWKFSDTDGDHVADRREASFTQTMSGCGNGLHGPSSDTDGLVY